MEAISEALRTLLATPVHKPAFWCILGAWLLIWNIAAFAAFGLDKQKAKAQRWRTPERRLWLFTVLGGSLGATLGMRHFRHKTKHWRFRLGVPLLLLLHAVLLILLLLFTIRSV